MELTENRASGAKYLTFDLGRETYALPILKVKEIIRLMEITSIPRTPRYMKGVINLRGKVIPIMDLRLKLGLPEKPYNERTCIIVVDMLAAKIRRFIGLAVDIVSEVASIQTGEIKPPPEQKHHGYLSGIAATKERVIMLLDIEQIIRLKEETDSETRNGGIGNE